MNKNHNEFYNAASRLLSIPIGLVRAHSPDVICEQVAMRYFMNSLSSGMYAGNPEDLDTIRKYVHGKQRATTIAYIKDTKAILQKLTDKKLAAEWAEHPLARDFLYFAAQESNSES